MTSNIDADLCVVGAGSAGLSVAAGAAQLGQRVVLCERGAMGGDCLNFGCVPSKALIAAGRAAQAMRDAAKFGVAAVEPAVDARAVRDHIRGVIAAIEPNDSQARFEGLGVTVLRAPARFVDDRTVECDGRRIRARRFVVATGSTPFVPPIPGLDTVRHFTNETIFDLDETPRHLLVIGGGPIGCELAQAHRRLGAAVSVIEAMTIMPKDDPELVDVVRRSLQRDGVALHEGAKVKRVAGGPGAVRVTIETSAGERELEGTHLLVAAGRRPNVAGLDLEKAGVAYSAKGITVDDTLRTTNRRVFAIGDVAGGLQFTHIAGYHAGIVVRRALFRLPAKAAYAAAPWVTYSDPELANVGLTEAQARERHGDVRVVRWPFHDNDRAQAERDTEGLVKAVATGRGRILGAAIVGAQAGELIQTWVLAMTKGLTLRDMTSMIAPYPTRGEASKRAAGAFFTGSLFSDRTRWLVRLLARFG
ncbi:MAG: FAD-dependent oxidoreductase [Alphaproteobacteria bacterium]|nr:FAD-dependent oxidoreductase [Alphaproteobacteria bacterium]